MMMIWQEYLFHLFFNSPYCCFSNRIGSVRKAFRIGAPSLSASLKLLIGVLFVNETKLRVDCQPWLYLCGHWKGIPSGHPLQIDADFSQKAWQTDDSTQKKRPRKEGDGRKVCASRSQACRSQRLLSRAWTWSHPPLTTSPWGAPAQYVGCTNTCSSPELALRMKADPLAKQCMGTEETRYSVRFYISHFRIQKKGKTYVCICLNHQALGWLKLLHQILALGHCIIQKNGESMPSIQPFVSMQTLCFLMEKRCEKAWKCLAKGKIICSFQTFMKIYIKVGKKELFAPAW